MMMLSLYRPEGAASIGFGAEIFFYMEIYASRRGVIRDSFSILPGKSGRYGLPLLLFSAGRKAFAGVQLRLA